MAHAPTSEAEYEAQSAASVVDSLLHPQAALIRGVLAGSEGDGGRLILIDDEDNIVQALRAGLNVRAVFRSGHATFSPDFERRLPPTVSHYEIAWRTCKKLFGNGRLSRIFATADRPPPRSLDALLPLTRDIVVLDGVGISGNIGAIIRSCVAMGARGLVLVNAETADVFDRRVIRASRGHVFASGIVTAAVQNLIEFCARHGLPLVVTEPRASTTIGALSHMPRPLALVYGSEKGGCSPLLRQAATLSVGIPTLATVESLNVAAAAAIALYSRYPFNCRACS